jgi:hypothetical protein
MAYGSDGPALAIMITLSRLRSGEAKRLEGEGSNDDGHEGADHWLSITEDLFMAMYGESDGTTGL